MEKKIKKEVIPYVGSYGKPIKLYSNFYNVNLKVPKILLYSVEFEPHIESRGFARKIIRSFEKEIGNYVFTGSNLYSLRQFENKTFDYLPEESNNNNPERIKITLKKVREIHGDSNEPEILAVFNNFFKKILFFSGLKQIGAKNKYYRLEDKKEFRFQKFTLQIIPGYDLSLKNLRKGWSVHASLTYKILNSENCLRLMKEMNNNKVEIDSLFVGAYVYTDYNKLKPRTYKVVRIAYDLSPRSTFMKKDKEISYLDYYYETYHQKIRDDRQALFESKYTRRVNGIKQEFTVFLIPELCILTGITDEMRDSGIMREISKNTISSPSDKFKEMNKTIDILNNPDDPKLAQEIKEWGLFFDSRSNEIGGRQFPNVDLLFDQKNS